MKHRVALYWRALSELETHWDLIRILTGEYPFVFQVLAESAPPEDRIPPGTAVTPIRNYRGVHPAGAFLSGWKKPVREWQPDLFLGLDEPYCLQTYRFLRWTRRWGIPFVYLSCQNIDRPLPWPFSRFEQTVCVQSRGAWFLNQEAFDRSCRRGFGGVGKVIPLGVNLSRFSPGRGEERDLKENEEKKFTVGYVGRLVPEKGIDDLVSACAGMEGIRLLIVGDGPDRSLLERLATTKGVEVDWRGWVSPSEMGDLYAEMDVLVLPSRTTPRWKEQFGRVLIEAMAAEVPVVGSDSGEIPKVVGDSGLVFPEGDRKRLREILRALLVNQALRDKMRSLGLERVRSHYTWEKSAEALASLMEEVLVQKKNPTKGVLI